MAERDGLTALEMRVTGHHGVRFRLSKREDHERKRVDLLTGLRTGVEDVETERSGDLVVAERPAWILRPTSPSCRSIEVWTSSSESR